MSRITRSAQSTWSQTVGFVKHSRVVRIQGWESVARRFIHKPHGGGDASRKVIVTFGLGSRDGRQAGLTHRKGGAVYGSDGRAGVGKRAVTVGSGRRERKGCTVRKRSGRNVKIGQGGNGFRNE